MANLKLFPTYYPTAKNNIFHFDDIIWSFNHNGKIYRLNVDDNGVINSDDPLHDWNVDDYEIHLKCTISTEEANTLYGGVSGIACKNATIGVAILWSSPSSFQRGVFEVGELLNLYGRQEIYIDVEFPKSTFRDSITMETILYIKKEGTPKSIEAHLANTKGCIVGSIDERVILVDGQGSMFPSMYINAGKSAPLWVVTCNWEDACTDPWEDSVSLDINKDNKFFKFLDRDSKDFDYELLREIQASAISLIVEKLRSEGYTVDNWGDEPIEGSVAMVVKYIATAHKCDLSTPIETAKTIRQMIERLNTK